MISNSYRLSLRWSLLAVSCVFLVWIGVVVADEPPPAAPRTSDPPATEKLPATIDSQPPVDAATPAKTKVEDRSSRAAARAKGDLNFDDLKFDIEKDGQFTRSMLPKEIEELNKRNIRIRGYILPQSVFKVRGFEEFVLVRDNMECCFGPGAALYDCIMVRMEPGQKADFTTRPVSVKGKFEIKEFKYPDSDQHYAIYQLIATEVQ